VRKREQGSSRDESSGEIARSLYIGGVSGVALGVLCALGYATLVESAPDGNILRWVLGSVLFGLMVGGALGVATGLVVGVSLRALRHTPTLLAGGLAALLAGFTVLLCVTYLGPGKNEMTAPFSLGLAGAAALLAGVLTPWIRRAGGTVSTGSAGDSGFRDQQS